MEAVEEHISELEAVYLAEKTAKEIRKGKIKTISWDKVQSEEEFYLQITGIEDLNISFCEKFLLG
jgi:predicted DNA-binding protein